MPSSLYEEFEDLGIGGAFETLAIDIREMGDVLSQMSVILRNRSVRLGSDDTHQRVERDIETLTHLRRLLRAEVRQMFSRWGVDPHQASRNFTLGNE
jgi:hypothetical protein